MIIAEAFLLSIVIGILRGGKPARLADVPLRALWLAFIPLTVQIGMFAWEPLRLTLSDVVPYVHVFTYLVVGAFVWVNRTLPGMRAVAAGILCNGLAIVANGGYMPASASALAGAGMLPVLSALAGGPFHNSILINDRTALWFLGDVFHVPPPFPTPNVFSIGDVLIAIGLFILAQRTMCGDR